MGRRYIIEHIAQTYRLRQMEQVYRVYVTDCLKAIADNQLRYMTRDNNIEAITKRYLDVIKPKADDNRSAEEVARDIIQRAGLNIGWNNGRT